MAKKARNKARRRPRRFGKLLARFRKDKRLITRQGKELLQKHPNQWVAVHKTKLVFGKSHKKLLGKLGKDAPNTATHLIHASGVIFTFVDTSPLAA